MKRETKLNLKFNRFRSLIKQMQLMQKLAIKASNKNLELSSLNANTFYKCLVGLLEFLDARIY